MHEGVPGYASFAQGLMAEAATRLQAIATGAVPYKADGAFVLYDCHVLSRVAGFGLYAGADWCLNHIETFWLNAALAPDPAAKSMPSHSLTISLANATIAEPWPKAYLALCKVAAACRHAGIAKKPARVQKAALTAMAGRSERMLAFDPDIAFSKPLKRAFRVAVESLLARTTAQPIADWHRQFAPPQADGWHLAQGLIWQIDGITCMPVKAKSGLLWQDVNGATVTPDATAEIRLWHPVETPPTLATAWRAQMEQLGITQPFLRACRQLFTPDPTEMATKRTAFCAGRAVDGTALFDLSRVKGWQAGVQNELLLHLHGTRFTFHAGIRAAPIGGHGISGDLELTGPQTRLADVPPHAVKG